MVYARLGGRQPEPDAMALATATASALPSARFVLLRDFDERGFVFYTNGHSRKGVELTANPVAAVAFRWSVVDRQVRIVGSVAAVDTAESDEYFAHRSRGSQLGAWASPQSEPLEDWADLQGRLAEATERFAGAEVPRPPWWGGFRISPTEFEFWQQGADRLHDRFRYTRAAADWTIERLGP
jgi:pyridoxamine 5'-phosphate oxidase